jgi:hypothetical protein
MRPIKPMSVATSGVAEEFVIALPGGEPSIMPVGIDVMCDITGLPIEEVRQSFGILLEI